MSRPREENGFDWYNAHPWRRRGPAGIGWEPLGSAPKDGTIFEMANCWGIEPNYSRYCWGKTLHGSFGWRDADDPRMGIMWEAEGVCYWRHLRPSSPAPAYDLPLAGRLVSRLIRWLSRRKS